MENIGLDLFFEFFVSRLQLSPLTYQKRTRPILSKGEALSSRKTQKTISLSPNGSQTHDLPEYRLDALTTELWETRGEQGHMLGSDVCDTCPAILQGSTCRNDRLPLGAQKNLFLSISA